ncbi:MAG: citrate transporter [Clostridia bacterium]|nr:citrate transporter [Clostridia bacterium]
MTVTIHFIRKNTVLVIAAALALVTSLIVPPDADYIGYFDFKTLTCLFCTLAVICALKNVRFFTKLAERIVVVSGNTRTAVLLLVYITFIGSMLLANDMALLTFLPLGYYVMSSAGKERYMAFTFIMQNIAANLGGMLTPFGNPQNLYLYEKFRIANGEFVKIMLFPFLLSVSLITLLCLVFVKGEKMQLKTRDFAPMPKVKVIIYLLLFAFSILLVFRTVPYYVGLILIPLALLFLDKSALLKVDYPLLFTFVFFFIFAGNMARIDIVENAVGALLSKNTLLVSALSCQFISNVPSAILLSEFTTDYRALLMGVNIGGAGTLIASLASLITLREFTSRYPEKTKKYIILFSVINFAFLLVLAVFCSFVLASGNFGLGF